MTLFWIRVRGAGILLALILVAALYVNTLRQDSVDAIRRDLNDLGTQLCEQGKESNVLGKYNGAIDALILDYTLRRDENEARGDDAKAQINSETIGALKQAKIKAAPADCSKPLLPAD